MEDVEELYGLLDPDVILLLIQGALLGSKARPRT